MFRKNEPAWRRLALSALSLALGVAGCAGDGFKHFPPATSGTEREDIVIHAWRTLTQPPQDAWSGPRSALYTYVLIGDAGGNDAAGASPAAQDARRALDELLKEVQAGQPVKSIADKELLARVNQFCVPARGYRAGRLTLDHYDFDLAGSYLNRVRFVALSPDMSAHLGNVGPFLVGTRKPLGDLVRREADGTLTIDTRSPLLLMDLSGMHRKSMPAYVFAYKKAVLRIDPSQSALLQPLGPHIASILLEMGEAVPFVSEAYAGTQKKFTAVAVSQ